jgi:hypothetical protein
MAERQHAGIDGQNNIIVQIEDDNNAVNLKGWPHLLGDFGLCIQRAFSSWAERPWWHDNRRVL